MARIAKADHGRILRLVDGEGRKVAEVAAEYGCTPANIYALLARLRRAGPVGPELVAATPVAATPVTSGPVAPEPVAPEPPIPAPATDAPDLFAAAPEPAATVPPAPAEPPPAAPPRANPPRADPSRAEPSARPAPVSRGGVGARLAKPGFGLVLRTADGEDSLTPFRSLEDLLSAVKPILRTAARSPEPVWFSIRPIDLASLDDDP